MAVLQPFNTSLKGWDPVSQGLSGKKTAPLCSLASWDALPQTKRCHEEPGKSLCLSRCTLPGATLMRVYPNRAITSLEFLLTSTGALEAKQPTAPHPTRHRIWLLEVPVLALRGSCHRLKPFTLTSRAKPSLLEHVPTTTA